MQTDQISSKANDPITTYRRFNSNLTPEQLETYFTLTENDLMLVQQSRYDHTRLGVAVQLCTLKFLNTFLPKPSDVPEIREQHWITQRAFTVNLRYCPSIRSVILHVRYNYEIGVAERVS